MKYCSDKSQSLEVHGFLREVSTGICSSSICYRPREERNKKMASVFRAIRSRPSICFNI